MANIVFGNVFDTFRDFDRIANSVLRNAEAPVAPAYDIVRTGNDAFEVVLAVPGFAENEIAVSVENGTLSIRGEPAGQPEEGNRPVRRGINRGKFELRFALGEHVQVKEAELRNGLLTVRLAREVPEALKPRTIAINQPTAQALPQAA
jgi:molecular chaperone IbpA